jgi:hypothetical protein
MRRLLLAPTFHSQWVELEAFVREASIDGLTGGRSKGW